jgi:hypothetical protein
MTMPAVAEFTRRTCGAALTAALEGSETARVRDELLALAHSWRDVLAHDIPNARPIVTDLLVGRLTYVPTTERHTWIVRGEGTLKGLFSRAFVALGGTSPAGFEPASWP